MRHRVCDLPSLTLSVCFPWLGDVFFPSEGIGVRGVGAPSFTLRKYMYYSFFLIR